MLKQSWWRRQKESVAWWLLVRASRWWAGQCMDQFDKFKFVTPYGTIYVAITRHDPYPDSFDAVDKNGRPRR